MAEHDRRFRVNVGFAFDLLEHPETLIVPRTSVSNRELQAFDGLDIVRDDVRVGVDDFSDEALLTLEVRDEYLDENPRMSGFDLADRLGEVTSPLIRQVVPVDRRQNDVIESDFGDRLGDVCGSSGPTAPFRPFRRHRSYSLESTDHP